MIARILILQLEGGGDLVQFSKVFNLGKSVLFLKCWVLRDDESHKFTCPANSWKCECMEYLAMSRPIWLGWKHVFARPFTLKKKKTRFGDWWDCSAVRNICYSFRGAPILFLEPTSGGSQPPIILTPGTHSHMYITHAEAYACTYNNFKRLLQVFFALVFMRHVLVSSERISFLP